MFSLLRNQKASSGIDDWYMCRYIINENILEVENLEKLFKMAQKGDY